MPDHPPKLSEDQAAKRRFVWPPRPVEVAAPPQKLGSRDPGNLPPPRIIAARPHSGRGPVSARPRPAAASIAPTACWRARLLEVERIWLGLATPPLQDRIAEGGWAPDDPGRYCPRCGTTVGPHEGDPAGCAVCRTRRLPWQRLIRLGEYTGLLQEVVQEVKFSRWRRLGDQVGGILGQQLAAAIESAGMAPDQAALVPVPSSLMRRMKRGIDHSLVIARGVSRETGIPLIQALTRTHRPSQLSVPASQRRANVVGSIRPKGHLDLGGRLVIVLDDVTTTRATLTAACRAVVEGCKSLSDKGEGPVPKVWAAVLAVTPRPGDRRASGGAETATPDEHAQ